MRFTASKSEVTAFKIKVQYSCTDFDKFWTREKGFPAVEIGEDGKFSARFTNSNGSYTSKLKGTLTGKTAKGNFSAKRTYNADGKLDPDGNVTCYVRKTKWTAKKRRADLAGQRRLSQRLIVEDRPDCRKTSGTSPHV